MKSCRRAALISVIAIAIGGCIATARPVPLAGPYEVGSREGLLLLETEANSEIEKLVLVEADGFGGSRYFQKLPSGRYFHLFAIPEGEYRWVIVELPSNVTVNRRTYPVRWTLDNDPDLHVSVRAGHLNYSGAFYLHRWTTTSLSYRSMNRSGKTLDWLQNEFPGLLSRYPIRYGGPGRDDFLEFYHGELHLLRPDVDLTPEEAALGPESP